MIRAFGVVEESYTDGPGIRCAIFTQGCKHRCHNCHNPETWSFEGGTLIDNEAILKYLKSNPLLDGVTFTGGDPMYQAKQCTELAMAIKNETTLNIWCYTGFKIEQLTEPEQQEFMRYIDVLVDGPYVEAQRNLSLRFRGSSNQRIIDVKEWINNKVVRELQMD